MATKPKRKPKTILFGSKANATLADRIDKLEKLVGRKRSEITQSTRDEITAMVGRLDALAAHVYTTNQQSRLATTGRLEDRPHIKTKRKGWINIYGLGRNTNLSGLCTGGPIYDTRESAMAERMIVRRGALGDTILIEWEE